MLSQSEKKFIKENYPSNGCKFCADNLKINKSKIMNFVFRNNIKVNYDIFVNKNRFRKNKIDINVFKENINQYSAYILGFLWADGHLSEKNRYNIGTEITTKDAEKILSIFLKTGDWSSYSITSPSKKKWQPQTKIFCSCKELFKFLEENDYVKKSDVVGPTKILSLIPKEFHNYFFRGLSDGDGCFYFNGKQYLRQYSIASSYNQDWGFFTDLLDNLSIEKYKCKKSKVINKKSGKLNGSSCIRITNKEDIKKLGNYIYSGELFGLERKYEIYKKIIFIPTL